MDEFTVTELDQITAELELDNTLLSQSFEDFFTNIRETAIFNENYESREYLDSDEYEENDTSNTSPLEDF